MMKECFGEFDIHNPKECEKCPDISACYDKMLYEERLRKSGLTIEAYNATIEKQLKESCPTGKCNL